MPSPTATSTIPADLLNKMKSAKASTQFQVPSSGRSFAGELLKTDELVFQPQATLKLECGGYDNVVILADKLVFQHNFGPDEDLCMLFADPEKGIERVDGQDGADGVPGVTPPFAAGADGKNGSPGGDGSDGVTASTPSIYFIAFSIEDLTSPGIKQYGMQVRFDGIHGGDGGAGGKGGDGSQGAEGQHAKSTLVECEYGPGWGGRGGDAGRGGNGANGADGGDASDIHFGGGNDFLAAQKNFKVSNAGGRLGKGGAAGNAGKFGKGGGEGGVDGWCSPVGQRVGRSGKPAADGLPGKNATTPGKDGGIFKIQNLSRGDFFP